MYSKVSICKTCVKRVLDEQLEAGGLGRCIYCLVAALESRLVELSHKRQDLTFAMELLEHSRTEVLHLYETAIAENERLSQEIHKLREELEAAKGVAQYKVDINRLIG